MRRLEFCNHSTESMRRLEFCTVQGLEVEYYYILLFDGTIQKLHFRVSSLARQCTSQRCRRRPTGSQSGYHSTHLRWPLIILFF